MVFHHFKHLFKTIKRRCRGSRVHVDAHKNSLGLFRLVFCWKGRSGYCYAMLQVNKTLVSISMTVYGPSI